MAYLYHRSLRPLRAIVLVVLGGMLVLRLVWINLEVERPPPPQDPSRPHEVAAAGCLASDARPMAGPKAPLWIDTLAYPGPWARAVVTSLSDLKCRVEGQPLAGEDWVRINRAALITGVLANAAMVRLLSGSWILGMLTAVVILSRKWLILEVGAASWSLIGAAMVSTVLALCALWAHTRIRVIGYLLGTILLLLICTAISMVFRDFAVLDPHAIAASRPSWQESLDLHWLCSAGLTLLAAIFARAPSAFPLRATAGLLVIGAGLTLMQTRLQYDFLLCFDAAVTAVGIATLACWLDPFVRRTQPMVPTPLVQKEHAHAT